MLQRVGLVLAVLWLALALTPAFTLAQTAPASSIVFTGTVLSADGTPAASSPLELVVAPPAGVPPSTRYCATGRTDANGSFSLTLLPLAPGCNEPGAPLELLVNDIPAQPVIDVPPGPGVYPVVFTLGSTPSGQVGPAQTGPGSVSGPLTTPLPAGCSQIVVALGAGAGPAQLVGDIANRAALVAIWRFDNAQKRFRAFFADPSAPSDLTALAPVDAVFICVSQPTSITVP